MSFAIADTCFLIDWALWRRRNCLFKLFDTVFVPEAILNEVRSEETISWIAEALASNKLSIFTETPDVVEEARALVERTRLVPGIRGVDLPEALCLVVGRRRGYTVLTENRGALMATNLFEDLSEVRVWRALEVIAEAIKRGFLQTTNVEDIFIEYEHQTRHRFPRAELNHVIQELRGETS